MAVYDCIKSMTKDELQDFMLHIYLWGFLNAQCNVDDKNFFAMLLDADDSYALDLVKTYDNMHPVSVHVIPLDGSSPYYLSIKFYDAEDAVEFINKHNTIVHKLNDTQYATTSSVYTIIPERR